MRRLALRLIPLALALLLIAFTASLALGDQRLGGKVRFGDTVTVPATETVDGNLYLFGGTVDMAGTVKGDLVIGAGTVHVTGKVDGDVLVGGGTVDVSGNVAGDVRVGAGQTTIGGTVGGDVLLGSGTVTVSASVGKDLIVGGGTVTVSGNVTGSILGSAADYSRTGTVGGTEDITRQARPATQQVQPAASGPVFDAIRQFVVVLLLGALALWLMPGLMRSADDAVRRRILPALGVGFLAIGGYAALVIVILLLMILLAIVLGWLTLGALLGIDIFAGLMSMGVATLTFVVLVAFVADAVVGLSIGRFLLPAVGMRGGLDRWQELGALAVGSAIVVILTSIPVIGWIVKLFVVLIGLGALTLVAWGAWRSRPPVISGGPMTPVPHAPEPPASPA